jgi:hypothetical protein
MGLIVSIVATIGGGFVAGILKTEAEAWAPRAAEGLRKIALKRLVGPIKDRLSEEWAAYLDQIPGPYSKLISSAGFIWAANKMAIETRLERAQDDILGVTFIAMLTVSVFMHERVIRHLDKLILAGRGDEKPPLSSIVLYHYPAEAASFLSRRVETVCRSRGLFPGIGKTDLED